jgi:hypothetical protein
MFDVQDVVVPESRLVSVIGSCLSRQRAGLQTYRSQFTIESKDDLKEWSSAESAARFILALAKHKQLIANDFALQVVGILNADRHPNNYLDYQTHTYGGGLQSHLRTYDLFDSVNGYVRVSPEFVDKFKLLFEFVSDNSSQDYSYYKLKKSDVVEGGSLLARAYAQARRDLLSNGHFNTTNFHTFTSSYVTSSGSPAVDGETYMSIGEAISLSRMLWASKSARPTREQILVAKNEIIYSEQAAAIRDDRERKIASRQNFSKYWQEMKSRAEMFAKGDEILASFSTIPMLPVGTVSSRTWGIEVEVVQDDLVSRKPAGWRKTGDGSLQGIGNGDNYCDCGCDDCDDGSHCGYDDCSDNDDGNTAEYVSPILRSFNSAGLQALCSDLDGSEVNDTPGIHIHVGADGLVASDVARLLAMYSAASPFIWPLMERETRNYCRDVTSENIAYWLGKARDWRNLRPTDENWVGWQFILEAVNSQPDDRYRDVNLQALNAHGTIEFRAMGPIYNYERLTRWAWMVREMVNVSKLDIPQSTWTNLRSMADLVRLLRQFGSEQLPEDVTKLYEVGDDLSVEENAESNN